MFARFRDGLGGVVGVFAVGLWVAGVVGGQGGVVGAAGLGLWRPGMHLPAGVAPQQLYRPLRQARPVRLRSRTVGWARIGFDLTAACGPVVAGHHGPGSRCRPGGAGYAGTGGKSSKAHGHGGIRPPLLYRLPHRVTEHRLDPAALVHARSLCPAAGRGCSCAGDPAGQAVPVGARRGFQCSCRERVPCQLTAGSCLARHCQPLFLRAATAALNDRRDLPRRWLSGVWAGRIAMVRRLARPADGRR